MSEQPPTDLGTGSPPRDRSADDRRLLGIRSRQSPVAVVFIAGRFIRNLGAVNIGLVLLFLFSGRLSGVLFAVGVAAAAVGLVFMVLAWWRFVFVVERDELLVTKGVIAEERLTIPLSRIQSVSIDQKLLHRPMGLVRASVDTAGSSEAEFIIDAIDRTRAEALQRLAAGHRRQAAPVGAGPGPTVVGPAAAAPGPAPDDHLLIRRTPLELVRIGITRWPWAGLVALAPLVAVLDDIGEFLPIELPSEETVEGVLPDAGGGLLLSLIVAGLTLIVAGALLGALLQVVRELTTNWDLTLWRTATGFRRTAGLLSTTSRASTLTRIQAVQTRQSPAQRLIGIRRLTLPTIGEGDLAIPGTTDEELAHIRQIVFDDDHPPRLDRMISRHYVFLRVRNLALVVLPVTALVVLGSSWWGLLALVALPISWTTARRQWARRRWGLTDERMGESLELVTRHTAELELIKAQMVSVTQSFFERRRGLATVRLDTADGHLAVPLIDEADARAVRDRVLHAVETDRRPWM